MELFDKLITFFSQIDSTKLIILLALVAVIMALVIVFKVIENGK